MSSITIDRHAAFCSDELFVRFYVCPACKFERVPYGLYPHARNVETKDINMRAPTFDAQHCPVCGGQIVWT